MKKYVIHQWSFHTFLTGSQNRFSTSKRGQRQTSVGPLVSPFLSMFGASEVNFVLAVEVNPKVGV